MPSEAARSPKLSVILATDRYATIRTVIDRWRRQTIRDQVELVLIAPNAEALREAEGVRSEFAGIQVLYDPVADLAPGRVAGIRAATAPIVFVGETHSYPSHPEFAEKLLAPFDGPWTTVTPSFGNANPKGALSWAGLLADYGYWADGLPPAEIHDGPVYNAAFRKTALLDLGDRLAALLTHGDELWVLLRAAGHRVYFQPAARLDHANVARPLPWAHERFLSGLLIAYHRSRRWSWFRRLVYVGGSFLIPAVLAKRTLPGILKTARGKRLPLATIPAIVLGLFIRAIGEVFGYLGYSSSGAEQAMHEYEVHKLAYIGPAR